MLNEPGWVSAEGLIIINKRMVASTGEPHSILSSELLESAAARPQQLWGYGERDVAVLAAALLFGVARNHPFQQGNKRTGFTAAIGFLGCNGYKFMLADDDRCAGHIIDVLEKRATEESFSDVLRQRVKAVELWGR